MCAAVNTANLRREIEEQISRGAAHSARLRLNELWREERGPATAAFLVSRYESLKQEIVLPVYRVAILRSFTVEPLVPLLRAEAFSSGLDLAVHVGDFRAYAQELLDPQSAVYRFQPDCVILAVETADIAPDLWRGFNGLDATMVDSAVSRASASFQSWINAFRKQSQAAMIVHNLEHPPWPARGTLDSQVEPSQASAIERVNQELRRAAAARPGVYVLDYDGLVSRYGRLSWRDPRKWHMARLPISTGCLAELTQEWMRFLAPLAGRIAKVAVVDLDNTLWGGIIGEDGMTGIKLSPEYPGVAYQDFQRALLDLTKRGILLAVSSKNNPADAMEALEKHPGMILRPEHFAALRINWNPKAQELSEIARELNVGVDSLAFLDDNPVEREQVRLSAPEVMVIDLPDDPFRYEEIVRAHPAFQRLTLSTEDQQRSQLYAVERARARAEQNFQSKEDFFRFLEQQAIIEPLTPQTLARIAQLTQKTNQFNLTTRRYGEAEILALGSRPGSSVVSIRVEDRFGDHGLVGVAITRDDRRSCEIDTFLLSCRVIGRSVETVLLAHLAEGAASRGCRRLTGWFLPTKKNAPARDFYLQHGFELAEENGEGSLWALDLTSRRIAVPDWIKVTTTVGGDK
ncbi:MAG: HAD family hydrolase [Acidobacteria bacterium]|nr:HAD family hydrolase [Acidobacteriota bacterium]